MDKIIKNLNRILNNIKKKGINYFSKEIQFKTIIAIIIIIIVFVITCLILKQFNLKLYDFIDHEKKHIIFGQTCDLKNNQISIDYSIGFQLGFNYINNKGGINNYKMKIILLDDEYEPKIAIKNYRLFVDYYNVLAIIGTFGTPTTLGILDQISNHRKISLISPYSGSTLFRKNFNKYLIITNGGLYLEFELLVESLLKNKYTNISIIYQNDLYGKTYYNLLNQYILEKNYNINIISTGTYERNTDDYNNCFKSIFKVSEPFNYSQYNNNNNNYYKNNNNNDNNTYNKIQAIIIFSAEKEIGALIGFSKKIKPSVAIYYNFFVGTLNSNLKYIKNLNKENVYQTLLSKKNIEEYPELNKILLNQVKQYNEQNEKKLNNINTSLIDGFYNSLMICKVLENFKDFNELNRESFIDMFYKMKIIDIYGFKIGPFILDKNNVGIRYSELNKLQENMTFKTINYINKEYQPS